MKYLVLNFAYGFGPFLRTTEVAFAVAEKLERKTGQTYGVLAPLVYGEKQKRIMREAFGKIIDADDRRILFDENLGECLKEIFYGESAYAESLKTLIERSGMQKEKVNSYFKNGIKATTYKGAAQTLTRSDIVAAIARAPRLDFGIEPAYNVSFALVSEILKRSSQTEAIKLDRRLLHQAALASTKVETSHRMHLLSEPGTFSYLDQDSYPDGLHVQAIPPTLLIPQPYSGKLEQGIYLTVTGIPGLDRLFKDAQQLRLKIYTNQPEVLPGSTKASPEILNSPAILLHFARAGWGSAWLSQFTGTPFIMPPYDATDDPEIYFNNLALENLGLGTVYDGQPLSDLLALNKPYVSAVEKINGQLLKKFGTLNGIDYAADKIVEDYLQNYVR